MTVTIAPGATESGVVYLKSLIVMVGAAVGTLGAELAVGDEDSADVETTGVD